MFGMALGLPGQASRCRWRMESGTIAQAGGSYAVAAMTAQLDFESLVSLHYVSLYRFALSLTRKESDASDLTQQTFYVWAAKGHQLEDPLKVKSWLFTTLYREFLQLQRKETRFIHEELDEASAELPSVDGTAVDRLEARDVVQLLGRLHETFQAPLALFYLEDYPYREIAGILGIPLGTVKSRIARGIAQLQMMVSKEGARARKGPS
jgi:RNA polymerase sigma-70 factor (ECF subfamily)